MQLLIVVHSVTSHLKLKFVPLLNHLIRCLMDFNFTLDRVAKAIQLSSVQAAPSPEPHAVFPAA